MFDDNRNQGVHWGPDGPPGSQGYVAPTPINLSGRPLDLGAIDFSALPEMGISDADREEVLLFLERIADGYIPAATEVAHLENVMDAARIASGEEGPEPIVFEPDGGGGNLHEAEPYPDTEPHDLGWYVGLPFRLAGDFIESEIDGAISAVTFLPDLIAGRIDPDEFWWRVLDVVSLGVPGRIPTPGPRQIDEALPSSLPETGAVDAHRVGDEIPPGTQQREFREDYDGDALAGQPGDALLYDINGNPLVAPQVFGRREVGGPDVGATPEQIRSFVEGLTGKKIADLESYRLDRLGNTRFEMINGNAVLGDGFDRLVRLRSDLEADAIFRVLAHEFGHLVDHIASRANSGPLRTIGGIKGVPDLEDELRYIYNDLNNDALINARREAAEAGLPPPDPNSPEFGRYGPEDNRYQGEAVHLEMMAEAIRAYIIDPNYIKTYAPGVASVIRQAVNTHPVLRRYFQLNSLIPPFVGGVFGAGLALGPGEEVETNGTI